MVNHDHEQYSVFHPNLKHRKDVTDTVFSEEHEKESIDKTLFKPSLWLVVIFYYSHIDVNYLFPMMLVFTSADG